MRSLLLLLAACGGGDASDTQHTDLDAVTYWDDVAPLYMERCVACHQEGGIGPFALDDYDSAVTWAQASVAATEARTMPPWFASEEDACNTYMDSEWLSDEELATLSDWVAAGTPEGTPRDDLEVPATGTLEDGVDLDTPTYFPERYGGNYAEYDDYRCFLVEPGIDTTQYLTGYQVFPGNTAIVHHVIAMAVDLDGASWRSGFTNAEQIENLTTLENDDQEGWTCFSGAGSNVAYDSELVTWAPGQDRLDLPEGTGLEVPAGSAIVLQVHYNLYDSDNLGSSDQTTVRLELKDSVETPLKQALLDAFIGTNNTLEVGEDVTFSWDYRVGEMTVYGVLPHMHGYGRALHARFSEVESGEEIEGTGSCLVDVENWDYNWQRVYFLEDPIEVAKKERLFVDCHYDTSAAESEVSPGWGTQNEMCLVGLYYAESD